MAKIKTVFVCQNCGYESLKWIGKCPNCSEWNSMVEETKTSVKKGKAIDAVNINEPRKINTIKSSEHERMDTGIEELNRVLGGGIVTGSLTLISGAPGIGKSTLLLQTANNIASKYGKVLYISGEESEEQIKMRGDRLGANCENIYVLSETNLDVIERNIEKTNPKFVIIDSIQTLFKDDIGSAPGSVSQVRESSNDIMRIGKTKVIAFFIVAHITKQGQLAGPRVLEHMVDTVLFFEGERNEEFRILRTIKNRFGTTSEIGVFEMRESGLCEISNPSRAFLEETNLQQEGSTIIGIMEGTRPILIEVQALVSQTKAVIPRRTAVGVDNSRLSLILAVLEKKLKIPFYNSDVYVNVVGGLEVDGTYGDLGIALSLISSAKSISLKPEKLLVVGEIGLTGEVRPVSFCDRIISEAGKMGFTNVLIPDRNKEKIHSNKLNVMGVSSLKDALNKVF